MDTQEHDRSLEDNHILVRTINEQNRVGMRPHPRRAGVGIVPVCATTEQRLPFAAGGEVRPSPPGTSHVLYGQLHGHEFSSIRVRPTRSLLLRETAMDGAALRNTPVCGRSTNQQYDRYDSTKT